MLTPPKKCYRVIAKINEVMCVYMSVCVCERYGNGIHIYIYVYIYSQVQCCPGKAPELIMVVLCAYVTGALTFGYCPPRDPHYQMFFCI